LFIITNKTQKNILFLIWLVIAQTINRAIPIYCCLQQYLESLNWRLCNLFENCFVIFFLSEEAVVEQYSFLKTLIMQKLSKTSPPLLVLYYLATLVYKVFWFCHSRFAISSSSSHFDTYIHLTKINKHKLISFCDSFDSFVL
jgi:hypothetical protein